MPLLPWLLLCAQVASEPVPVEGQPLAAGVQRLLQALDFFNTPLPADTTEKLRAAVAAQDPAAIQKLLDPHVLCLVHINPESRVKVARGAAPAQLLQSGYRPFLVKVHNEAASLQPLRVASPAAGQVFGAPSEFILKRMQREALGEGRDKTGDPGRFLELELHTRPPLQPTLSGLAVEYLLLHLYSRDAGKREATLVFDIGQGTQDLGFRAELPVLFDVRPAVKVLLDIKDVDGRPSTARLVVRDAAGHVHPAQAKRLAPDFFFQDQIYRRDGEALRLPPGRFTMSYSRGPEYLTLQRGFVVPEAEETTLSLRLERWFNAADHGFYSGDHHIHGSGCAHYTSPSEGVTPADLFANVKGEGLNVGCILTWGPGFDAQRVFFSPQADKVSESLTLMKYDLEISGFGSQALGHVCLLNLKDQVYPGTDGGSKGWPTWTVPVLRWTKEQGGVTGYPHTAMNIDGRAIAGAVLRDFDADKNGVLSPGEADQTLLPEDFKIVDADGDGSLSAGELAASCERKAGELPNLVVPRSVIEICVSTALGLCDFISAMNTARVSEWNTWYHLMNSGFPLKVSGETDFPCMSGSRVGEGRVYVQLGKVDRVEFPAWIEGVKLGRSYVSDGFAQAPLFEVDGVRPGFGERGLPKAGVVKVRAQVAFAPETPKTVSQGLLEPPAGRRVAGDTVLFHVPKERAAGTELGGRRLVELVVNGRAVAARPVEADGKLHDLEFEVPVERSSWIALRQFPQLHTNPVNVIVAGQPIRASRASARWCREMVKRGWASHNSQISAAERPAARKTYDEVIGLYERIIAESPEER